MSALKHNGIGYWCLFLLDSLKEYFNKMFIYVPWHSSVSFWFKQVTACLKSYLIHSLNIDTSMNIGSVIDIWPGQNLDQYQELAKMQEKT